MSNLTSLLQLKREQLLALDPNEVYWQLSSEEILHLWAELNGSWFYDYRALAEGRPGLHAKLKSKKCSDGFFMSRAVLNYANLRELIAVQMVRLLQENLRSVVPPDIVCGIPDGARELGYDVARILGLPVCEMVKEDGKLRLASSIAPGKIVLKVEDFCTAGTGFKESVGVLYAAQPKVQIFSHELVILNRGGLSMIEANGRHYGIAALVTQRVNDWEKEECPLHRQGSNRIKPKDTNYHWYAIHAAQLPGSQGRYETE